MTSLFKSLKAMVFFTILLGIIYPFFIMSFGYTFAKEQTKGSQVSYNGDAIGSSLIGQDMPKKLFQGRPSASNNSPMATGGTNLAVNNQTQLKNVKARLKSLQNKYGSAQTVPEELLFASGSGVDPDISVQAAMYQVEYIVKQNDLKANEVMGLIKKHTNKHLFGVDTINVLNLNLDLLKLMSKHSNGLSELI